MFDQSDVKENFDRLDDLLDRLDTISDRQARTIATEAIQTVLEVYGEGLSRLVSAVTTGDEPPEKLIGDPLVAQLLIVHDLHPLGPGQRVERALGDVRPYLNSHGGDVSLVSVDDGVATVRLQGSCRGCPSSAATLELAVEEAVFAAAPDVERVVAEGADAGGDGSSAATAFVPLDDVRTAGGQDRRESPWQPVANLPELDTGTVVSQEISTERVVFTRLDGSLYAYADQCPACAGRLDQPSMTGGLLTCAGCEHRYDVRGAGTCVDTPELRLEPVPLLTTEQGTVQVALPAAVG